MKGRQPVKEQSQLALLCLLRQLFGSHPIGGDFGSTALGECVEAVSWCHVAQDRNLVRPVADPAELIEAAQHAVRAFSAIASNPHLLVLVTAVGAFDCGTRAWRCDRYKFAPLQLAIAAEDDLDWLVIDAQTDVREPDSFPIRVRLNFFDPAGDGSSDADDHCESVCTDWTSVFSDPGYHLQIDCRGR